MNIASETSASASRASQISKGSESWELFGMTWAPIG